MAGFARETSKMSSVHAGRIRQHWADTIDRQQLRTRRWAAADQASNLPAVARSSQPAATMQPRSCQRAPGEKCWQIQELGDEPRICSHYAPATIVVG
jgi:hypothetical protein